MGNKRRNAKDKTYTGRDANTTNTNSYGGGSRNNDKYAVFDFADDELRVETESRKTLAKFGTKSPGKKPACDRKAVDKYVFLECCKSMPAITVTICFFFWMLIVDSVCSMMIRAFGFALVLGCYVCS